MQIIQVRRWYIAELFHIKTTTCLTTQRNLAGFLFMMFHGSVKCQ